MPAWHACARRTGKLPGCYWLGLQLHVAALTVGGHVHIRHMTQLLLNRPAKNDGQITYRVGA